VLGRAWDRFEVPLPFTRVAVVVGEPRELPATSEGQLALACAIEAAKRRASEALRR
jgi:lysophospholipid acyltransferase (LPLAT)-like uncharacterized protein